MPRRLIILLAIAACAVHPLFAQPDGEAVMSAIRGALEEGQPEKLMRHAGERVDLTIFGTSELLSRTQAMYVLKSFFTEHPPTDVQLTATTESDGNWFASAGYWYELGPSPLTVYVRLRSSPDGWELRELRIDRPPSR